MSETKERTIARLSGKMIAMLRAEGATSMPIEQIPEFIVGIAEMCAEEYKADVPAILLAADTAAAPSSEGEDAGPWIAVQAYEDFEEWAVVRGLWQSEKDLRGPFTERQAIGIRNFLNRDSARDQRQQRRTPQEEEKG